MDDDWGSELNFEFIDWNEITDAEFSGDQEAIERLMNQSQEIRRQNSVSETPQSSDRGTPCCISTPNDSLPFANFSTDRNVVNSAPPKPTQYQQQRSATTPFSSRNSIGRASSYAQITRGAGKVGKRRVNERVGLSPIDLPRKKNFRQLFSPPPPPKFTMTTPDPLPITTEMGGINLGLDTSTPETDRIVRAGGVQRRLFGGQASSPHQDPQLQETEDKENKLAGECPPWVKVKPNEELMSNLHRLAQRQKQIDMGKETVGYERYTQMIPKWKRGRNHPWTPDKYKNCSTRAWQGQMKLWRRNLHKFDPPSMSISSSPLSTEDQQQQQEFTAEDAVLCEMSLDNIDECPIDM